MVSGGPVNRGPAPAKRWDEVTSALSLGGMTALVTGAGSGLGRGMAQALAEAGARVACVGRRRPALEETVRRIAGAGGDAVAIVADVTRLADIERVVQEAARWGGGLHVVVNNAGVDRPMASVDVPEAVWDEILATNLKAPFFISREAARIMRRQRYGRIINVGSLTSQIGISGVAPYSASKGGLVTLSRALAAEWATDGITVNVIAPGYFRTEMTEPFFQDEGWCARLLDRIPMRRVGEVGDLAGAVVFLASPAAAYVTGQVLFVDGGFSGAWRVERDVAGS